MTKSLSTSLPADDDLVPVLFPLLAPAEGMGHDCLPIVAHTGGWNCFAQLLS